MCRTDILMHVTLVMHFLDRYQNLHEKLHALDHGQRAVAAITLIYYVGEVSVWNEVIY